MIKEARWLNSNEVLVLCAPMETRPHRERKPEMRLCKDSLVADGQDAPWYNIVSPSGWTMKTRLDGLEKTYASYEFGGATNYVYWFKGQEEIFIDFFNITKIK